MSAPDAGLELPADAHPGLRAMLVDMLAGPLRLRDKWRDDDAGGAARRRKDYFYARDAKPGDNAGDAAAPPEHDGGRLYEAGKLGAATVADDFASYELTARGRALAERLRDADKA